MTHIGDSGKVIFFVEHCESFRQRLKTWLFSSY